MKLPGARIGVTPASSLLLVCLPFGVLEKFFAGDTERKVALTGSSTEQEENRSRAQVALLRTRVAISARLPEFRLTMRELGLLSVGSVVATGLPRSAPLVVRVGDQSRFQATVGRLGSSLAVRLLDHASVAPDAITRSVTAL